MESAKIYPLNRNRVEGSTTVNAPASPPKPKLLDQVRQAPHAALQSKDRGNLCSLDQAVHLFPPQAASCRDGGSRDSTVPFQLGNRVPCKCVNAKPGIKCCFVPLSAGPVQRDWLRQRCGSCKQAEATTDGFDTTRNEVYFRKPCWFGVGYGHVALWSGPATDGMPASQG